MLSDSQATQARTLRQLMPRGQLWLEPGSWLARVLQAVADELGRVQERGADLVNEADPRTTDETLADWERVLGLPDADVTTIPATPEARRVALVQKMVARPGGQSRAFFIGLAAACGYTATISDGYGATVFRAGFRAGARVYGIEWAHAWRLDVQPPTGAALSHAELEAVIRRAAPAHTAVLFTYL